MTTIFPGVNFSFRETPLPFIKKMPVKNKVLLTPENHHRHFTELGKRCRGAADDVVSLVAGCQRYVLDEAEGGDAVRPGVVGEAVEPAQFGWQRIDLAADKRSADGKGVQAAYQQGADEGVRQILSARGNALAAGRGKAAVLRITSLAILSGWRAAQLSPIIPPQSCTTRVILPVRSR